MTKASTKHKEFRRLDKERHPLLDPYENQKIPVLEHVNACLKAQDNNTTSSSFLPFIRETLAILSKSQDGSSTVPVHSIVFGQSSEVEMKKFLKSFNEAQEKETRNQFGKLPNPFWSLNIQYLDNPPHILRGAVRLGPLTFKVPARLSLGFWNQRWDIIFPFTTGKNVAQLTLDKTYPDYWISLFQKLNGYAIGINIGKEIENLKQLVSYYRWRSNQDKRVEMKTVDLNVLLCMAGWNTAFGTLPLELNLAFTGRILKKSVQAVHISNMNTAVLCSILWLMHWFATPAICALCSRKDPIKFLSWFSSFQVNILAGAHFKEMNIFNWAIDRRTNPSEMIAKIQYKSSNCQAPILSAKSLSECIPTYRNVTSGGPASDQEVIDSVFKLHVKLQDEAVPKHLRWQSCKSAFSALTGKSPPSATGEINVTSLGCHRDKAILSMHNVTMMPGYNNLTLRDALLKHNQTISRDDPRTQLSGDQLLLLFIWKNPKRAVKLYEKSQFKYFQPEDLNLVRPLIMALAGRPLNCKLEDNFKKHKRKSLRSRAIIRYDKLSSIREIGSKERKKMSKIQSQLKKSPQEMALAVKKLKEERELEELRWKAILSIINDSSDSESDASGSSSNTSDTD